MDSSSSDDIDDVELSSEAEPEFVDVAAKVLYSTHNEVELESVKQKERQLGFRRTLIQPAPTVISRIRAIIYTFLNVPSSSILVCNGTLMICFLLCNRRGCGRSLYFYLLLLLLYY